MTSSWDLLDQELENELHKNRLLNVEEKPFKRVSKRINSVLALSRPHKPANGQAAPDPRPNFTQVKEDLTLDFAAFDSSVTRLQFLHQANQRERERYSEDQHRILAECQAVRANNAQLRDQLEAAQATLAQRKEFDVLADKITSNRLLRPREDQMANLAKLEEECRELERESDTYSETWQERKEQFNRIMEEGMMLRRQIRDEKEEVDRREGMNEDDDDAEPEKTGQTPRPDPSGNATPHPDAGTTPRPPASQGGATPLRERTPAPDHLKPPGQLPSASRAGSQVPASRDATPAPQPDDSRVASGEDVDMEEGETSPQASGEDKMEVDN